MATFIFGHKNPDTDSVCSSIALAYLKNELGDKCVPKVLGNINAETKFVLDHFKVDVPSYLNDVRVRIKKVKYDRKAYINENASIDEAFKLMQKHNITAIPLVDDAKMLTGYVTLKELAKYLINGDKEKINTTLDNILATLDAKVITKYDSDISGNIMVVGMQSKAFYESVELHNDDILIVGDRYRILDYAIDSKVKLIILPVNSGINDELLAKAKKNKINIIETSLGSYLISNKILLANFIKSINTNHNPVTVNNEDCFTDFKQMTHQINHTNYPVVNNKGECLGLIRLTGPNTYEKQKVILVDHNNFSQSVDGIEEADILEIIDHHNLGAIGTSIPINFRCKPVGCTATMIYDMFVENKVAIPKPIAGILLSAILSDTLLLSSPTTTEDDKFAAIKLASISKTDIDKYGLEMFKAASSIGDKSVKEIILGDFKKYLVDKDNIGLSQFFTTDFEQIQKHMTEYVDTLNEMASQYRLIALFITDVIRKGSYVIYNSGSDLIIKEAFGLKKIEEGIFIPKIVSRKKDFLPSILGVLEGD